MGAKQLDALEGQEFLVALVGGLAKEVLIQQEIGLVGAIGKIVDHKQARNLWTCSSLWIAA